MVLAQGSPVTVPAGTATTKQNPNTNKISCSISEKYSIVYSYNTVLGEEPDLKVVNLICIALKKKKRQVVFESVVNYIKTILEKNDNLRQKAGTNAFKSIFSKLPSEAQMQLLNQIVFEGPTYSYSELKVLIDLNKDRFLEIENERLQKQEKGKYDLAEKDGEEEADVTTVEKTFKALTQGTDGSIQQSGFCTKMIGHGGGTF